MDRCRLETELLLLSVLKQRSWPVIWTINEKKNDENSRMNQQRILFWVERGCLDILVSYG